METKPTKPISVCYIPLKENIRYSAQPSRELIRKLYQCHLFLQYSLWSLGVIDIYRTKQFLEHSLVSAFDLQCFESQQRLIMMSLLPSLMKMKCSSLVTQESPAALLF